MKTLLTLLILIFTSNSFATYGNFCQKTYGGSGTLFYHTAVQQTSSNYNYTYFLKAVDQVLEEQLDQRCEAAPSTVTEKAQLIEDQFDLCQQTCQQTAQEFVEETDVATVFRMRISYFENRFTKKLTNYCQSICNKIYLKQTDALL